MHFLNREIESKKLLLQAEINNKPILNYIFDVAIK